MNITLTLCGFVGSSIHAAMLLHGFGCLDGDRVSISVYSGSSCHYSGIPRSIVLTNDLISFPLRHYLLACFGYSGKLHGRFGLYVTTLVFFSFIVLCTMIDDQHGVLYVSMLGVRLDSFACRLSHFFSVFSLLSFLPGYLDLHLRAITVILRFFCTLQKSAWAWEEFDREKSIMAAQF
jgi:hypothetical protein